jgi:hypothetical protein
VPERELVLVLLETEYPTPPLPEPLAPEVMPIHGALLVAVQLQPAGILTVILPLPPAAGIDPDVGLSEAVQDEDGAENLASMASHVPLIKG